MKLNKIIGLLIIVLVISYKYYKYKKLINNIDIYDSEFQKQFKKNTLETTRDSIRIHIPYDKNVKNYLWKDAKSVLLKKHALNIEFENEMLKLSKKEYYFSDWYSLLAYIPEKLKTKKINDLLKEIKSDLITCDICGKVAVYKGSCLYCGSGKLIDEDIIRIFNLNTDNKRNDYYKKELVKSQLFWFSTEEKDKNIEFYEKDDLFENDDNWKPVVTISEVKEYSVDFYKD